MKKLLANIPRNIPRAIRILVSAAVLAALAAAFLCDETRLLPQAGPAFLAAAAGIKTGALAALAFAALALLFGRVYCAALCPLGILQDIIGWLADRLRPASARRTAAARAAKRGADENAAARHKLRLTRYAILAATLGFLAAGWALAARHLEPFTLFGRMTAALRPNAEPRAIAAAAATFTALLALTLWKRRIFCAAICPVGALLGLLSKISLFRLAIKKESCVHCALCAAKCPVGAIDPKTAAIDDELCVRCMNCVPACNKRGIAWKTAFAPKSKPAAAAAAANPAAAPDAPSTRRKFLITIPTMLLATLSFGKVFKPRPPAATTVNAAAAADSAAPAAIPRALDAIFPPGAGSAERFASRCTGCMLCAANCTGGVIKPPTLAVPTVHLDYDDAMCEFNCAKCGSICPTGALRPMTLEKKKLCRVGMVAFDEKICVAFIDGNDCGACAEHCPTGALRMEYVNLPKFGREQRVPVVNEALCIGCGNCSYPCPVRPERAIVVKPIPIQVEAADPNEFFKNPAPPSAPSSDDDWLI